MSKEFYQEDVIKMTGEIMDVIDKHMSYEWSGTAKSDEYYDKFQIILEELCGYPDFRNGN